MQEDIAMLVQCAKLCSFDRPALHSYEQEREALTARLKLTMSSSHYDTFQLMLRQESVSCNKQGSNLLSRAFDVVCIMW